MNQPAQQIKPSQETGTSQEINPASEASRLPTLENTRSEIQESTNQINSIEKRAANALTSALTGKGTGEINEIKASNPELGDFLEKLAGSPNNGSNMLASNMLSSVFKITKDLQDSDFSDTSINNSSPFKIQSGQLSNMSTGEAMKLAVAIGSAIVTESAKNAAEESKKVQEAQSRNGPIPAAIAAELKARYSLAEMTPSEIAAAVDRLMTEYKKIHGESVIA